MESIEHTILKNLLCNEEYSRKVIPFIKTDYFQEPSQKITFEEIVNFISQYNTQVTVEALLIEITNRKDINDGMLKELQILITNLEDSPADLQWLFDTTEKWCRDRAIYLALMDSINIADGNDEKKNRDAIPSILSEALAVSFDNNIGHDYFANADERFDFYHQKQDKIPFDLSSLTRLQREVLLIRVLMSLLLGQASVSLCSCAIWLAPFCLVDVTCYTLQWRWQRRKLLNVLTQTSSMFPYRRLLNFQSRCLTAK